jgi:hypothetical protein
MGNKLMSVVRFTFETHSTTGLTDPQFKVLTNADHSIITVPQGTNLIEFFSASDNGLELDFFSKTERDTIINNGVIECDTQFHIEAAWCDGIRLEQWFVHHAIYYPRYFTGFLEQFPDSLSEITAPYQFNFPGMIKWAWAGDFWDWYFKEKNEREVINFMDNDPDRIWKFRGSLDPCTDIVTNIKKIMDI